MKKTIIALFVSVGMVCYSGADCLPPDPINVELGVWGKPPAFSDMEWPGGDYVELEIRRSGALFYLQRIGYDDWWSDKYMFRDYLYRWDEDGETWLVRRYIIGAGPGKLRAFPVGEYTVKWRAYCSSGWSPWSAETAFTIGLAPDALSIGVTAAPELLTEDDELYVAWTNNFAASSYQGTISIGRKVVRRFKLNGGFGFFGYGRMMPGLDEQAMNGGSYQDRPKSVKQELPNGYAFFRVRGYSPVARKWSDWSGPNFHIERAAPGAPELSLSQEDFDGLFDRSLRPFFTADYPVTPANWSYFDIRQRDAKGRLKVIRRQWLHRDQLSQGYLGGSGSKYWQPWSWQKDIPPGEYVWRVGAYSGPAAEQVTWSATVTSTVYAAGTLSPPDASMISYQQYTWGAYVKWPLSPNAYTYKFEIWRNGKAVIKSKILEPKSGYWPNNYDGIWMAEAYLSKPLPPADNYQIRVQAISAANPGAKQSDWSAFNEPFGNIPAKISGQVTGPTGDGLQGIQVNAMIPWGTNTSWPAWADYGYTRDDEQWIGRSTFTDSRGNYAIDQLPTTTLRVFFTELNPQWDYTYAPISYPNGTWFDDGDDVPVIAGQHVSGIDVQMSYYAQP